MFPCIDLSYPKCTSWMFCGDEKGSCVYLGLLINKNLHYQETGF